MFANKYKTDFLEYLQPILLAYRVSVHESTGYSPFELEYGRKSNAKRKSNARKKRMPKDKRMLTWKSNVEKKKAKRKKQCQKKKTMPKDKRKKNETKRKTVNGITNINKKKKNTKMHTEETNDKRKTQHENK